MSLAKDFWIFWGFLCRLLKCLRKGHHELYQAGKNTEASFEGYEKEYEAAVSCKTTLWSCVGQLHLETSKIWRYLIKDKGSR